MDKTIEAYLTDFKQASQNFGSTKITQEERAKFNDVSSERVQQQLLNANRGENPQVERIDPLDGKVIYQDSHGRNVTSLENLGYNLFDGKYVPSKTLFAKAREYREAA